MHTEEVIHLIITKNSLTSDKSKSLWKKTSKVIPCGVQTLSKMPSKFIEGVSPIYIEQANGCYVYDDNDRCFIDYPCGLGAILLGYNNKYVNEAVKKQIDRGQVFTLPSYLETTLAEKIIEIIPCAEQVRFLKTGSEATSAAIKIARAYTNKDDIAYCGYHGWHDWYTVATPKNQGIPKVYEQYIHKFDYNNIESLEKLFKVFKIGAVILEPYIYDAPQNNFLQKVIDLAHKNKALVIFDEVVTGFRTKQFSAQALFGVSPDLTAFGKALGNGFPIAGVCGKRKVMRVLEDDCFVSSTFGGDLVGITAALATLYILQNEPVTQHLEDMGTILKDGYNEIAKSLNIDTKCIGFPNRTMFMFPSNEHKSLFWQEAIAYGVLFGYAQFINYAHKETEIFYTLDVIKNALTKVKEYWDNPLEGMKGKVAKEVFRLVCTEKK